MEEKDKKHYDKLVENLSLDIIELEKIIRILVKVAEVEPKELRLEIAKQFSDLV